MPKVAGKRFPYTKSGKAAAEKAEKKQMSKREMMKRMKAAR